MAVPTGKHRAWTFTWNNYPEDLAPFNEWLGQYLYVYGFEEAPETGTPHLQGYVEFHGGTTYKQLRDKFVLFWAPAKGSREQNWKYCTKGGRFESSHPDGFPTKRQGSRSDIQEVKDIISLGGGMRDVLTTTKSYQAARFGEMMLKYIEKPRDQITEVIWICGPSGVGKTTRAAELAPNAWWSGGSSKWFDGYDSHEEVVIDDLRPENWPFVFLLRLLDSKPFRVECKGGSRQWRPKKVIITTLLLPAETYRATNEPIEQLIRRITDTIELAPAQKSGVIRCEHIPDYDLEKIIEEFL